MVVRSNMIISVDFRSRNSSRKKKEKDHKVYVEKNQILKGQKRVYEPAQKAKIDPKRHFLIFDPKSPEISLTIRLMTP